MNALIDPNEIKPLHSARNKKLLKELASDMQQNGWQGRPLLVIKRKTDFFAWTGSHRIAAATQAGLSAVPCWVVNETKLLRHDVDAEWGHTDDLDRLKIIRKLGDETALHIMWCEERHVE